MSVDPGAVAAAANQAIARYGRFRIKLVIETDPGGEVIMEQYFARDARWGDSFEIKGVLNLVAG